MKDLTLVDKKIQHNEVLSYTFINKDNGNDKPKEVRESLAIFQLQVILGVASHNVRFLQYWTLERIDYECSSLFLFFSTKFPTYKLYKTFQFKLYL